MTCKATCVALSAAQRIVPAQSYKKYYTRRLLLGFGDGADRRLRILFTIVNKKRVICSLSNHLWVNFPIVTLPSNRVDV